MTHAVNRRVDRFMPDANAAPLGSQCLSVLAHLGERLLLARARGENDWQSDASVAELTAFGVSVADCGHLMACGLIEAQTSPAAARHPVGSVREPSAGTTPSRNGSGRVEGGTRGLRGVMVTPRRLGPRTSIVLSESGLALITKHALASRSEQFDSDAPLLDGRGFASALIPRYAIDSRRLSVAGVLIVSLPVQAKNLDRALTAIELSGWKERVPEPLKGTRGGNDHHHLANVALSLNARQDLICFSSDDGAICWSWRARGDASASSPAARVACRQPRRRSKASRPEAGRRSA
ncbi:MAG: hypothetical protein ACREHD_09675 [Pirellulales bacterium]